MLRALLNQDTTSRATEPCEGELFKRVELCGRVFELRYGYYEEKDRRSLPDIIYPDFAVNPIYTDDGRPFVTMMQDACENYSGKLARCGDSICKDCDYLGERVEWLGVCECTRNRRRE